MVDPDIQMWWKTAVNETNILSSTMNTTPFNGLQSSINRLQYLLRSPEPDLKSIERCLMDIEQNADIIKQKIDIISSINSKLWEEYKNYKGE
jgi:hypothetical protein